MRGADYVVVGAGSAGAVLAARLSEDASTSVVLLEAGPDYRSADASPTLRGLNTGSIVRMGGYHWPRLFARMAPGQRPKLYLRGIGVGGSSVINAAGAVRGLPADFANWHAHGCYGWDWEHVLPSYIRLENDLDFGDLEYHGRLGPLPISRVAREHFGPAANALAEAALDFGQPWCRDINAPGAVGVHAATLNARDGIRVSTNDAYLEPARGRPNLQIVGEALVEAVEWDGQRACGVRAVVGDDEMRWEAGEVLICAGAIHSPAILLRSGIGPAADLQQLGITPRVDLPGVGQNLCEHPLIELSVSTRPDTVAPQGQLPFGCVIRTSSSPLNDDDLSLFSAEAWVGARPALSIWAGLVEPRSRGRLHLRSAVATDDPWLEFNLLADASDRERLRQGVRLAHRLSCHPAFGMRDSTELDEFLADDAALDQWLLDHGEEYSHAAGTCQMGSPDDPWTVVDPACRVLGVDRLRVIDASVFPSLPRAAPHLTVVMIAERVSEFLRTGGS